MNDKHNIVERYIKGSEKHTRKQKLRDARRKLGNKNQGKKPRQKKLNPVDRDDFDEIIFETYEAIMPKGEQERRREIEKQAFKGAEKQGSEKDPSANGVDSALNVLNGTQGLVIETGSGMCRVDIYGKTLLCDIRGNVKDAATGYINPVAVGDQVMISRNGTERGMVEAVLPRRSVMARPYSPDAGKVIDGLEQIMVANVDRLLIVAAWREPYIWPALIDRYLIAAQRNQIEAVICINKIDLIEDQSEFDATVAAYNELGYKLLLTSTVHGDGLNELRELLKDNTTALAGLSGVGKSSLLTAIQPGLNLKVGNVSEKGLFAGQGRHTTTQSSLWKLDHGGIVIDTPGVRMFALAGIAPADLASWYPDFSDYAQYCNFGDCTHLNEPNCGVQQAVENGEISAIRYKNYTQIFDELSS